MSVEVISIIGRLSRDRQTGATRLDLTRAGTGEAVSLKEGSFLLRIFNDEATATQRCLIRHLNSGRETFVQSGPNLQAFIEECLLAGPDREPPDDEGT